jgi:Raf kinase inhibitor-like YbhB/YbcL family protein
MKLLLTAVAAFSLAGLAAAQAGTEKLLVTATTPSPYKLKVTSATFGPGGRIPLDTSAYGKGVSPQLSWSGAPARTKAYALLVEDPDAGSPKPFVHWVVYDIPASAHGFAAGAVAPGAIEGVNGSGKSGYRGPHPPPNGDHHYHFQLFALDRPLGLKPGADRDAVAAAMRGHILAQGDLVGVFRKPEA